MMETKDRIKDMFGKPLADERGSSSILLIIIMVALLSIGVVSVASAFANHRIAVKNADWNRTYYEQSGHYQEFIFKINKVHDAYMIDLRAFLDGVQNPEGLKGISKDDLKILALKVSSGMTDEKDRLVRLYAAHATAVELGLKSDLSSNISKTPEALLKAYSYRLPKKGAERELEVIISFYGDDLPILSYREIPTDFVYEEIEFTDIKE